MRFAMKLWVLCAVSLLFVFMPGVVFADHGICIKNNSNRKVVYSVKWFADTLDENDIPEQEFYLKPGESKVHYLDKKNYTIYLSYYKGRRKRCWSLDTYNGENKCSRKGYVFAGCGRSTCFNQEQ